MLTLDLGLNFTFRCALIVGDCPQPIFDIDVSQHLDLLIAAQHMKIADRQESLTMTSWDAVVNQIPPQYARPPAQRPYNEALRKYSGILRHTDRRPTINTWVIHHRETTEPQPFSRPICLPPDKFRLAEAEFDHILEMGITRPSTSP